MSLLVFACKSKSGDKAAETATDSSATTPVATAKPAEQAPANAPKTYTATFSPDTVILGKSKEIALKVIPVSATDLTDPDGKSQGIELTFKVSLTNKTKIGGYSLGVSPSDFRLILDNNSSISQTTGYDVSADPESTKESGAITYRLPPGTKPKTLNLFYDEQELL